MKEKYEVDKSLKPCTTLIFPFFKYRFELFRVCFLIADLFSGKIAVHWAKLDGFSELIIFIFVYFNIYIYIAVNFFKPQKCVIQNSILNEVKLVFFKLSSAKLIFQLSTMNKNLIPFYHQSCHTLL